MIHFNELKANIRGLFETFKKAMDYDKAMSQAIDMVCSPFSFEQVILPGKAFASINELKDYIRKELDEEVNLIVDDGTHYSLTDNEGHIDWYRPKKANDEIKFRFWNRYRKYLTHIKGWAESSVDKIDTISDEILENIEDPTIPNRSFDRRGLVVGYVQSGKTANFMGIVNKAIDSGYRIVIILAGTQESLRQQTQERIDEEVLGIDTNPEEKQKRIGVSTLPGETYIPIDYFTESNLKPNKSGDFNIRKSRGTPPSSERPILFVIKKNKSILTNLRKYLQHWIDIFDDDLTYKKDNVSQFNNLPLLIIDDEADQASINTKKTVSSDGDELDPTAINYCIREILNLFRQKVYIGFTATPFANIFIRHNIDHRVLGKDLFPSAFIKTLGAPSNYLGPKEVFGLNNDADTGLPIYRGVADSGGQNSILPVRHKADYTLTALPETLKQALKAFIISSAIRWYRGQDTKHNTMLIHCTRYNAIQATLAELVNDEVSIIKLAVLSDDIDILTDMQELYQKDFVLTSIEMDKIIPEWADIIPFIKKTVKKLEQQCRIINGTVGDILDYKTKARTGLWSIAIGGDKLSRGLTLEGLTISYFTRSTSLYDTLMQMGRWFGYRNGFEDLCRIYTTPDLFKWYRHISTAFESLREEFIEMSRLKLTPIDFGLRVEDHPDMMVTSVMKMRAADNMRLNYQGTLIETSTLPASETILKSNFEVAQNFILSLGKPDADFEPRNVWFNIPVLLIQDFLKEYQTYKGLPTVNSVRINQYIDLQRTKVFPEFLEWNVALISLTKSSDLETVPFAGFKIYPYSRSIKDERANSLFIKRMIDPKDEIEDFNTIERKNIENNSLSNIEIRGLAPRKHRPLLMIYVLNITDKAKTENMWFEKQPVGFAISWPASETAVPINYVINSVYAELELSEDD
ncbi:Z1 domain-containing protein [Pedobacter panaciterrae]|uniref:Z1 domain-containing protein n=1 Tax=Pedobacter panaciterrae TaxID=363849 RepID=A0ABU8NUI8_9SPHI